MNRPPSVNRPPEQSRVQEDEKHPLARMFAIGTIASLIGVALALWIDWFPDDAAANTDGIDLLYDILMIVSVPIFVLVMTVAIYSVWRYRARPGETGDGAPIHGNARLEVIWVAIPFVIVSVLAVYSWIILDEVEAKKENPLRVNAIGQQFAWHFEYPDQGRMKSNELVLPVNRPVTFRIRSLDVIHSFWVPNFRLKNDAVPGLTTTIRVTPDRIGRYDVVCAELCGLGHATMRQTVRVVPQREFDAFVARNRRGGGTGGEGIPGGATPENGGGEGGSAGTIDRDSTASARPGAGG